MAEISTGKLIALIRALATSSTSSATYTVTDALILGAATTSGVRLDLESGTMAVREGDDSGYASIVCRQIDVTNNIVRQGFTGALTPINNGIVVQHTTTGQQTFVYQVATASSALTSGASYTFTGALPDGAIILGVSARITSTITGPTSVQIGDGSDADRYGEFSTLTAGQTLSPADGTASPLEWRSAAGDVVLTAVGGNFTAGVVRLTVHYLSCAAPAS